ncbi:MAG: hypothetical protein JOY71_16905 [Acetobacteraceae bacterium]|nr:hypothetical protein [Acetobacteraceae bacterium]MBV8591854.1 hypothetical protein [Acetobacteraceae bacterium]
MFHTARNFAVIATVLVSPVVLAQAQSFGQDAGQVPYTAASLEGEFAFVETYAAHVAQAQGVYRFDGKGNFSALALINQPSSSGERVVVSVPATGPYTVNPDGTGTLVLNVTRPDGGISTVTQDLLITKAIPQQGEKVATEWVSMQREPSVIVGGAAFV